MAETIVLEQPTTTTETPVIAGIGKTSRASDNTTVVKNEVQPEGENETDNTQESPEAKEVIVKEEVKQEVPDLSPEQKKAFLTSLGLEYNNDEDLEKIKEQLKPKSVEPTAEERQAMELEQDKELLALFLEGGGKIEDFVGIKNIMNADVRELSKSQKIKELTDAGFDKDEAEDTLKYLSFQSELDKMAFDEFGEETQEQFDARKAKLEKKVAYFSDKLYSSAATAQKQALDIYNSLKQTISDRKLEAIKEQEYAANAEAYLKTLPRDVTFELGKLNGSDLAPVEQKYDEADIKAVRELITNPTALKQFLFTEDGSFNIANLTDVLLAKHSQKSIVRNALLEGQTRMTKIVQDQFPARNPYELGVGGYSDRNAGKGKVAGVGKVQRV